MGRDERLRHRIKPARSRKNCPFDHKAGSTERQQHRITQGIREIHWQFPWR
jgi:hypothetical protein